MGNSPIGPIDLEGCLRGLSQASSRPPADLNQAQTQLLAIAPPGLIPSGHHSLRGQTATSAHDPRKNSAKSVAISLGLGRDRWL